MKAPLIQNESDIFILKQEQLDELKQALAHTAHGRARINVHRSHDAPSQEMIIALDDTAIFLPHRHQKKSESFHIIEGDMIIMIFDNSGAIHQAIFLTQHSEVQFNRISRARYYRLDKSLWHSVLPLSPTVVFHETTNGPFVQGQHEFAPFINEEMDVKSFYLTKLSEFDESFSENYQHYWEGDYEICS